MLLGQTVDYPTSYSPDILRSVPRSEQRATLKVLREVPQGHGLDLWHGYELSWLDPDGKPCVAVGRWLVPADTPNLVESKSLKLYLNSFNMSRFASRDAVRETMAKDLSRVAGGDVEVQLFDVTDADFHAVTTPRGICLDHLPVSCDTYDYCPELLREGPRGEPCDAWLHSHLLRSNCLVTGQPDWASVEIGYRGRALSPESLLRYLVSFRNHREFHEHCVERIFQDIWNLGDIESLTVRAQYTRRGGLDINPIRSTEPLPKRWQRWGRQ